MNAPANPPRKIDSMNRVRWHSQLYLLDTLAGQSCAKQLAQCNLAERIITINAGLIIKRMMLKGKEK